MSAEFLPFARPWWLLALLPLSVLIWRRWRAPEDEAAWRGVIDAHLLPHLLTGAASRRRTGLAALGCGLFLAVLALAGPMLPEQNGRAYRRDALRVLVVDLSPHMAPHLERVKLKLLELLGALPDGQTALVVYAQDAYLVAPPTTDTATIARFIPELAIDAMPLPGNRPEQAMRMAAQLMERNPASERDVIWVTAEIPPPGFSGPDNARLSILHAADRNEGTNGGTNAGTQRRGDAKVLDVGMRRDNTDLQAIVSAVAGHKSWAEDRRHAQSGADIGYWLVLPLLPLAAFAFRRGVLMAAGALLCGMTLAPAPADARDVEPSQFPASLMADLQAWRLFESGNAHAAAARFSDRRWRAAASYRAGQFAQAATLLEGLEDADALYNRGNALARLGRLADALGAYDAALRLRPDDADTRHNRELVLRLLNQENPKQPPKTSPPTPPSPPPPRSGNTQQEAEREAARVAEQWLRRVPDEPATLLRRKLQIEHQRRVDGRTERTW